MIEPSAWIVDYEVVTGVSYGLEVKSYWTTKRLRTFDKHQVEYLLGQEALGGDTLHAVRNVEVISLYSFSLEAVRVQALNDAMQAVAPEDSHQDDWFKAKCRAVEQIRYLLPH